MQLCREQLNKVAEEFLATQTFLGKDMFEDGVYKTISLDSSQAIHLGYHIEDGKAAVICRFAYINIGEEGVTYPDEVYVADYTADKLVDAMLYLSDRCQLGEDDLTMCVNSIEQD